MNVGHFVVPAKAFLNLTHQVQVIKGINHLAPAPTSSTNYVVITTTIDVSTTISIHIYWGSRNHSIIDKIGSSLTHWATNRRGTTLPNHRVQCTITLGLDLTRIRDPINKTNGWLLEGQTMTNELILRWDVSRVPIVQKGRFGRPHLRPLPICPKHLRKTNLNELSPLITGSLQWQL